MKQELVTPVENNLWIVGKNLIKGKNSWEFVGAFNDEQLAIKSCRTYQYFVGPAKLNESLSDETCEWIGAYYPIKKENELWKKLNQ